MNTYYFYILNKTRLPKSECDFFNRMRELETKSIQNENILALLAIYEKESIYNFEDEKFELQNGQDVRFLVRFGCKEITEKSYFTIKEDDERIVKTFNKRTLELLKKYNHKTDGWHFPFKIEAKNRVDLEMQLKEMFPTFEEFCFLHT